MNRRNSSGGGQSSLGYLFGSDESVQQQNDRSKVPSSPVLMPPYGTDNVDMISSPEKAPTLHTKKDDTTSPKKYIYHRDGDKSKDFLVTGRPSTKVNSVPGGDSSLGYLFGDK